MSLVNKVGPITFWSIKNLVTSADKKIATNKIKYVSFQLEENSSQPGLEKPCHAYMIAEFAKSCLKLLFRDTWFVKSLYKIKKQ